MACSYVPKREAPEHGSAPSLIATSMRANWSDASLENRVSARLRWEKQLADVRIEVKSAGNGVIELKGTVGNLHQRRRAVELAEMTEGDIYETVEQYSRQGKLAYVHFRNVQEKAVLSRDVRG